MVVAVLGRRGPKTFNIPTRAAACSSAASEYLSWPLRTPARLFMLASVDGWSFAQDSLVHAHHVRVHLLGVDILGLVAQQAREIVQAGQSGWVSVPSTREL